MRKKYINSNKTDVNTIYYRDKKGKILASSSTYRTTSEKKLSKFSLILGLLSLFVILSSMFLTGYVDSKYENSYVEEVKVIEYKDTYYEMTSNNFDYIQTFDDLKTLAFKKLYIRKDITSIRYNTAFKYYAFRSTNYLSMNLYDENNVSIKSSYAQFSFFHSSNGYYKFINDTLYLWGNYINNQVNKFNTSEYYNRASYFYINGEIQGIVPYDNSVLISDVVEYLNCCFYLEPTYVEKEYIWFEYEYPTGYYDYDWNAKFEQLSKLRNVFNIGMIDFDKNLYYVNNYKYVRGIKNDDLQSTNYNLLFNDMNIQNLLPYCSVVLYQSWDEKIGSGKRDNYYLWYVYLDVLDDNATDTQIKLWNYVKDNYITQYTLDNYINYYALIQYEGFYKFTQVLTFPISIINNLMYDFGVLVRFVVDW